MLLEPFGRQVGDLLERAWFLKQMRCARDDFQFFLATQLCERLFIHLDHSVIQSAHNQQRWCRDLWQGRPSQTRPATARNDGADTIAKLCCSYERRGTASTGSKVTNIQVIELALDPIRRINQTLGQHSDIKPEMSSVLIKRFLIFSEQVKEECADSSFANRACDKLIARTMTAAA